VVEIKNVFIINQYTSTPKLGGGGNRSFYIASELVKNGFNVTLITSSYSHVPKRNYPVKKNIQFEEENGIKLVIVKNIVYESGRSIKRILSMLIFWLKLYFLPLKKLNQPDVIIVSSISLLPILNAFWIKRRCSNKPKVILEVRDIWPLSLLELGGFSKYNPFVMFLSFVEKLAYKKSDYLTAVLPLANKHFENIVGKKVKFKHISNGIHLESMDKIEPLSSEIKNLIPKEKFIVGYTGALGVANAMENFILLAKALESDNSIFFIIVGDGYLKDDLINEAKELTNIKFIERIPKSQIQSILSHFDLLYLAWHDRDIYNYGISANKVFEYMFSAKPILMVGNISESEVELSNCGKVISTSDLSVAKNVINDFKQMGLVNRIEFGKRGKEFVIKFRTYEYLSKIYIDIFKELELKNHTTND